MLRNLASLGTATLIRAFVGFLLFVIIARQWGASRFGEFMYFFAVAALLVQICEYGFSQQVLREVGGTPESAPVRMADYFSAKFWLTFIAWLLALVFIVVSDLDLINASAFLLMLLAGTFMSYSDLLMSCFRATGRYNREAGITLFGNVAYLVAALSALYVFNSLVAVAGAFALGRLIHLGVAVRDYRGQIHQWVSPTLDIRKAIPVMWRGGAYGLNVALGTVMVSLDSVLITHTLGFSATGEYQAAARFYQGAALLPPIFAGVFLPRMARERRNMLVVSGLAEKVNLSMLGLGAAVAAFFFSGPYWYEWVYPDASLNSVGALLPWFGVLSLVAYVASAQGISITALGGQTVRALMLVAALILMLLLAQPLMSRFGVAGMVLSLTSAYGVLAVSFWAWNARQGISFGKRWSVSMVAVALMSVVIASAFG